MKTRTSRSKLISTSRPVRVSRAPGVVRSARTGPVVKMAPSMDLTWSYLGVAYRVTVWPEVALEKDVDGRWVPAVATEDTLASGMVEIEAAAWKRYLEFMPTAERAVVEKFRYGRLAALLLVARCPQLVADIDETPALVAFLAAHAALRGTSGPRWDEVAAVHERGGLFAVLEWLGLPASRDTLVILRNLIDPDVPRRLLEPLRALLWRPSASLMLQRAQGMTDAQLAKFCCALAA
jgi:hypothetical protein